MKFVLNVIIVLLFSSCSEQHKKNQGTTSSNNSNDQNIIQMAEQIKIGQLRNALEKLKNGKTEFDFIGITSNGVDCIYFIYENEKFDIDFEAMTAEQIPYIEKLKRFADDNSYKTEMTVYGNKRNDKPTETAPVIHIETNLNIDDVSVLGTKIQNEVFGNNQETVYDVVP